MSSYFFLQAEKSAENANFIEEMEVFAEENKKTIYILDRPLTDQKYIYTYNKALILLIPGCKITILNYGANVSVFEDYIEDIIEDIGSISDKYNYKDTIGRPRSWRNSVIFSDSNLKDIKNVKSFMQSIEVKDEFNVKKIDLLISLFIGSINDIGKVGAEVPITTLDKVKQKIQLFDSDQTRFIYQNLNKKRITIQGLSGTGKTELLLHKLKDLYISDNQAKIYFTCFNKILADNLRNRIPSFFNFMKVEQQIEWEVRLWCTHSWGSEKFPNSGAYRYICAFYQISFLPFSYVNSFSSVCRRAIEEIKNKYPEGERKFAFTYMFIDESQDFTEDFFELCELVTERAVYVAGDVFQSIFDERISSIIEPDFLLGKCYRTDPKTLMFAHGLGMGLFENVKLRWLEEKEWKDCGYDVSVRDNKYYLSREPLRRFEDLSENFESIKLIETTGQFSATVNEVIESIIEENSSVTPDDIGIILMDNDKHAYSVADNLAIQIQAKFGWTVNKAYESKQKKPNAVLISNRNNVKGLEFPFVICVTKNISNSLSYRNAIYTMLTRSFLKSYLLSRPAALTEKMKDGLKEIIENKRMVIDEPTPIERDKIRTSFKSKIRQKSVYDTLMGIFHSLNIEQQYHQKLFAATQQLEITDADHETLTEFVKDNIKYLKEK